MDSQTFVEWENVFILQGHFKLELTLVENKEPERKTEKKKLVTFQTVLQSPCILQDVTCFTEKDSMTKYIRECCRLYPR